MIEKILKKIVEIRKYLENDPSTIVFAEIKMEEKSFSFEADVLKDYYELLNRYSYLSCGSILIFGHEDVDKFQYYLSDIPEGPSSIWRCIGKSHTYPIFININDCTVSILEGEPWANSDFRSYGHFNDFVNEYVVGRKYKELWGEDDWYNFLVNIGVA